MKLKFYPFIFLLTMISVQMNGQLFIDNSYTVEEMVTDFFDNSCVTPTNITTTGTAESVAFFDAGGTNLGVQAGIFISTGNVFDAIGPNSSTFAGQNMGVDGDDDLNNLLGGATTFDGITIEMDIIATGSDLEFSYVFASEEYPEFVGSTFNDVFGFFVSGPGISGSENIAMIPGSTEPVAINSINANTNSAYFVDNTNGQEIEFDGYTTEMTAQVQVTPNETYHVKIVVGDAMDSVFDSGIFLGVGSLCGNENLEPANISSVNIDGNTITFENETKYVSSHYWDFGDGTTSNEKTPPAHTYGNDGMYEVTLVTSNYCCSDSTVTMVQIGDVNSIENLEVNPFSVVPNPVRDYTTITFDNGEIFDVRIFDTQGRIVFSRKAQGQADIDFSEYNSGLYIMEVRSGGKVYNEKIVKN